ncbi:sensor histidine kinase [Haliscomenobacter hydrossis]|uniref:histidine kinase n=1 Tax=Haliscomenobacter hydrossis (strain ATCC 27775 / DSM 1100 / LMG 10767 / O) TaxID=760192 RepID=F4KXG5_HALH1|nr:ATP-binding protein [Haliscomenobacter hydrossis]AEE50336.1 multi-sensor signal transduction histidine kinase [Haliscomenobacter hydrossis DSM 1100]
MYLRTFAFGLVFRIILIILLIGAIAWAFPQTNQLALTVLLGVLLLWRVINLYSYVNITNRKLVRFLESVRYDDFSVRFAANQDDPVFRELSKQFNEVLDAFRQVRADKEANSQYLQTIVQHVNTGLLAFDESGRIELINNAALRLLGLYRLKALKDLQEDNPELQAMLKNIGSGGSVLYQAAADRQLSITGTSIRMRGKMIKLVAIQNIQSELENKELEAWQNLTRVLRHEIMNSVTPIASLVSTMRDIVQQEIQQIDHGSTETWQDLNEALEVVENRTNGLMNFVNAYRTFTSIPKPMLSPVMVLPLVQRITSLFAPTLKDKGIQLVYDIQPADLNLTIDQDQIEMVLINLIKNAVEILEGQANARIEIKSALDQTAQRAVLEVIDNGRGIEPNALEQIFIPFFTTKEDGTGVGLSLSRQILQMHGGVLSVESQLGNGARFSLIFKV